MNIVIINQPLENRGDEAAHRSLMRALSQRFSDDEIKVLFQGALQDSIDQVRIVEPNITYINFPRPIRGIWRFRRYALILNAIRLSTFLPGTYKFVKQIKNGDLIICAPGGICMGLFQDWEHIYWLSVSKYFKKKIVYYSRSFGPFPEKTFSERNFRRISFTLLRYFDFLSIRDSKTMALADSLNLNYVTSIDTAFLNTSNALIPDTIKNYLGDKYIVFVPNSLTWHPTYCNIDQDLIDKYYINIIQILNNTYKDHKIVMMPQIFNNNKINDKVYFDKIKAKTNCSNIIVLDDFINSDIQQRIIAGCQFVIGSRYHSIVFAINNNRPFLALSYEHKIAGLLYILTVADTLILFNEIVLSQMPIEEFVDIINDKLHYLCTNNQAKEKAREIANNCMNQLVMRYKV
ncbi:hypothetical protein AGMMS49928_15600 [Spirochaetia bacterium]|nr:hypothetical protein AGMMS49928_15600 [Spirochaetia bacterium]